MGLLEDDIPDSQFQRRRSRDREREDKIRHFTELLRTDDEITPADFLEAMANIEMLPGTGAMKYPLLTIGIFM